MNQILSILARRAAEPSSWAGMAAIIAAGAQAAATKDPNAVGAVVAGVLALVLPERKPNA